MLAWRRHPEMRAASVYLFMVHPENRVVSTDFPEDKTTDADSIVNACIHSDIVTPDFRAISSEVRVAGRMSSCAGFFPTLGS